MLDTILYYIGSKNKERESKNREDKNREEINLKAYINSKVSIFSEDSEKMRGEQKPSAFHFNKLNFTGASLPAIVLILAFIFTLSISLISSAPPALAVDVSAPAAILVEAETGQVLYEKNADKEHAPASITKIMTMLLTMEAVNAGELELDQKVIVSENASSMGGSQIYLAEGEELTVRELLQATSIASANDASMALAEAVAGSREAFESRMNERAADLGMENTNFSSPTGLPVENHYTTARDTARMSRELIQYPRIREWSQIWTKNLELSEREAMLVNTNRLILSYPDLDGIKTGFTREAGFNLAASAERGGMRLISVVLGAENENERQRCTKNLLEYGFDNYRREKILSEGETLEGINIEGSRPGEVSVETDTALYAVMDTGEEQETGYEITLKDEFEFPIAAGEMVGKAKSLVDDEIVHEVKIKAVEDIKEAGIFHRILRTIIGWFAGLLG